MDFYYIVYWTKCKVGREVGQAFKCKMSFSGSLDEGHIVLESLSNFFPNYIIDPVKDVTKNLVFKTSETIM